MSQMHQYATPVRENPSKRFFYTQSGEEKRGFPQTIFVGEKRSLTYTTLMDL
jgi:hypothetical protein